MRLRFAISGQASAADAAEGASETKIAVEETSDPLETTNEQTKIEAATGS